MKNPAQKGALLPQKIIIFPFRISLLFRCLGYCLKRYLAYLLRLRKQGEVEYKNKFYYQLLHEALPPENVTYYKRNIKSINGLFE